MIYKFQAGELARCPHCFRLLDDKIEDYVVTGMHGKKHHWYADSCGYCDGEFEVREIDAGYELKEIDA